MKQVFWITIVLFLLGACAPQTMFNLAAPATVDELTNLSTNYAKVEKLMRQEQLEKQIFSNSEWRTLLNVDATIDMLISRISNIFRLSDGAGVSFKEIEFLWGLSTGGYRDARSVIFNHWDEFTPATQLVLNNFDTKAEAQSTIITELMVNPTNDNMSQALTLITGVISIAVEMLGVAI